MNILTLLNRLLKITLFLFYCGAILYCSILLLYVEIPIGNISIPIGLCVASATTYLMVKEIDRKLDELDVTIFLYPFYLVLLAELFFFTNLASNSYSLIYFTRDITGLYVILYCLFCIFSVLGTRKKPLRG